MRKITPGFNHRYRTISMVLIGKQVVKKRMHVISIRGIQFQDGHLSIVIAIQKLLYIKGLHAWRQQ